MTKESGALQEIVRLAEAGDSDAGMALWQELASHRERGLDLSAMPDELVSWFDRRLEALTEIPAATKMGSLVTADEVGRQLTLQHRRPQELLATLCLKGAKRRRKSPGAPKSESKPIADQIYTKEVWEEITARWRPGESLQLAPIYRSVANRNKVHPRTVERAVKDAGMTVSETTEVFGSHSSANAFCQDLKAIGYRQIGGAEPVAPRTYKLIPFDDRHFVVHF